MRKIIFVVIGLILFIFTGCSEKVDVKIPDLKVTCNGKEIEVQKGGYSWTRKVSLFESETTIADTASAEQIASNMNGDNVSNFSELKLIFDREPKYFDVNYIGIFGDTKETKYSLKDNNIVLLKADETYVFEIIGKWEEGEVRYTIKVITGV